MQSRYETFDSARVELKRGINLVEASAGTGKTYAIGMLVVRALVELRVPIEKILIVTFTKAATEELKSRIRTRLVEARDLLRDTVQAKKGNADRTLLDWVTTIEDTRAAYTCLQGALYDLDRAGIFTIHGFCQRMLVEQALESGQSFDLELLADISHVRSQVADDFWRCRIYPLDPLPCAILTGYFPAPADLLMSVANTLRGNGRIEPVAGPVDDVLASLNLRMDRLAAWWSGHREGLYDCFVTALAAGNFKKNFRDGFEAWFQAIGRFLIGETHVVPENICLLSREQLAGELDGHKIRGVAQKRAYLDSWPLPEREVDELLSAIGDLVLAFRVELARELRREVSRRLEMLGLMDFNELILRLSRALQGEGGDLLKKVLGERYAVALIDEFQDTDSSQWHIFSTLFGGMDGNGHYLYLIGDPKQAIYKFRGADIYSYFLARKSANRLLTLEKNYRSHPYLVEEVNRLFSSRSWPFYFAPGTLDYRPVIAARKPEDVDLSTGRESLAGMIYCSLAPAPAEKNGRWTSGKAAAELRRFIVAELGRLLDPGNCMLLTSSDQRPSERSLAPHDIAILVRSNRQAEEYLQAVTDTGIPAVVASRQSVFQTLECREMLLLLEAVAAPGEIGRLKTAMTISWFGLSGNSLHEIWQSEERFSRYQSRFFQYNQLWQEQGLLPMMSKLLVEEDVLPILAARKKAERSISNIQQLLELIQEQENAESLGVGQVLQWLRNMMQEGQGSAEAELLLESDEEAVRIVTMHSAKGLEYPVVFCPVLWHSSKRVEREKYQITCHDGEYQTIVDLGSDKFDARREQAIREDMAEDLRLLYVALTRAQIRCYVGWADVKPVGPVGDSFGSALGYLLFPDGYTDYRGQQQEFAELAGRQSVQHLVVPADVENVGYLRVQRQLQLCPRQPSGRSLLSDWQMSSFSTMASMTEYDLAAEAVTHPGTGKFSDGQSAVPVPGLPAGANFGNVIHELLESFSFAGIVRRESEEGLLEQIRQKCRRYGVAANPGDVLKLLQLVVSTPLAGDGLCLAKLADTACLKEMGFYFQLSCQSTTRINALLADEPTFNPLSHKVMRGYLTGFVDLVCQDGGKYYILDYKTNFLGEMMTDYRLATLKDAMRLHNYGLQFWIYTLVVHRHLQNMLPDYNYHNHFGGVRYLFVRGMSPGITGSGVYATLPDHERLLEFDRVIGGVENG